MKKSLIISKALLLLTIFIFTGCSPQRSPKSTVRAAIEALSEGNVTEAEKYFTSDEFSDTFWENRRESYTRGCFGVKTDDLVFEEDYTIAGDIMIDVYVGTHEVDTFWMVEIDNRWYIRDTSYYCRNMPR